MSESLREPQQAGFKLVEEVLAAEGSEGALAVLRRRVSEAGSVSAAALLLDSEEETILYLDAAEDVSDWVLEAFIDRVRSRFEAESEQVLPAESVRVVFMGENVLQAKASRQKDVDGMLVVPVTCEGHVTAMLALLPDETAGEAVQEWIDARLLLLRTLVLSLSRVRDLTTHDPMTGLYNRANLERELDKAWDACTRYGIPLSVVVADLDNFKEINDRHGHLVGDKVLREAAQLMKSQVRKSDTVGRYGGDEIVMILPHATLEGAMTFGRRILRLFNDRIFLEGKLNLRVTTSIGVASSTFYLEPAKSALDLLERADEALYKAKRLGRNRVCLHAGREPAENPDELVKRPLERSNNEPTGTEARPRVLIADDNEQLAALMEQALWDEYEVEVAHNGREARAIFADRGASLDVAVLDINFPDASGIELLADLEQMREPPIAIMVTGLATMEHALNALRHGAHDFLPKPFRIGQFINSVGKAAELRQLRKANAHYRSHLEEMVQKRSADLAISLEETRRAYRFTLEALTGLLARRTDDTAEHSRRVRTFSRIIAEHMKLSKPQCEDLDRGALLHDIGKLAIPDAILHKPGKLDAEEWAVMKTHAELGYSVLEANPYLAEAADIVLSHHERWDGTGYPRGLKADEISLGARIFAVADAYDAMRSPRAYKAAMPPQEVREEVRQQAGKHFDPQVAEAFDAVFEKLEAAGEWPDRA